MKPINSDFLVYSTGDSRDSGCRYYRCEVPLQGLNKLGLSNGYLDLRKDPGEDRWAVLLSSDIVQFFAVGGKAFKAMMNTARKMEPKPKTDGGKPVYPPSFVFDLDDNIDWVHPFNFTYGELGVRAYDGTELKPGDTLHAVLPDGEKVPLWEDGVTTLGGGKRFDIIGNKNRIRLIHETAQMCDGVTVPSPALAKYYREVHKCEDVYVFPNSIIPEDYPSLKLQPHTDEVRILWQGGGSHMVDWFPLRDAVREVALKYPQAKFVIWGTKYAWVHDNIPPEQLEMHDWMNYEGYRIARTAMDADINLCPLADNMFNHCKSAIKWYESVMPHRPEATLASNVPPYSDEIVDGETGMLYSTPEEFVQKLGRLIEDATLRLRLGEGAKKWVMENRHYSKTVPGLFEYYQHLRIKKARKVELAST